jgi:hypothetical protein
VLNVNCWTIDLLWEGTRTDCALASKQEMDIFQTFKFTTDDFRSFGDSAAAVAFKG